jgi:3-phosphoshikimate 1-carboxyvinyltransferase
MIIKPVGSFDTKVVVPGDKSISHRYALLAGAAEGTTHIHNYSSSQDCHSTLSCLEQLGIEVLKDGLEVEIKSRGYSKWESPVSALDAGNSGTTIRLLSGLLAGLPFESIIKGDESLSGRPMSRIIEPLRVMGAEIESRESGLPPLTIRGSNLSPVTYELPVASAQVKSCVLLAGLAANGVTSVLEKVPTRDHTERALPLFGVPVKKEGCLISVTGPARLRGAEVTVPGDMSSAVFFMAAALLVSESRMQISGVGVNPSRSALLQLLKQGRADISEESLHHAGSEPCCNLDITYSPDLFAAFPAEIGGESVPNLIDEIPVLAIIGTQLEKGLTVRNASELRKKESDRIHAIVSNMRSLGIEIEEFEDGFHIPGRQVFEGGEIDSFGDHRIAMAFSIAGLISRNGITINNPDCVNISFPGFYGVLDSLRG